MRKIDRRIVIVTSFIFIVALSYGIMRFLIAQKEEPPAFRSFEARRYVKADVITYEEVISPVSEPGRMRSLAEVNISAEASGKIEQGDIMLKKGEDFSKGEVLFKIYQDEAILALKAKKSQFLNRLAIMLPDVAVDYPDYEEVFRDFFASIDLDKPLPDFPEFDNEQLQIYLAGQNILSDFYTIRKDELQLSRHIIRAPFDGTLTDVFLEVGAYTNTGGTVARAIRTDQLELEVPLRMSDASWIKIGDRVEVTSKERGKTWEGVVIRKAQQVYENTQSQSIFARISKTGGETLLAGEFLQASFPGRPITGVMEIPRNAVFNTNEVFIVKDRRLVKQPINVVKVNTRTLLFNGPSEGDTVVVQALINVFEGTQVTTSLDPVERPGSGPGKPGSQGEQAKPGDPSGNKQENGQQGDQEKQPARKKGNE